MTAGTFILRLGCESWSLHNLCHGHSCGAKAVQNELPKVISADGTQNTDNVCLESFFEDFFVWDSLQKCSSMELPTLSQFKLH